MFFKCNKDIIRCGDNDFIITILCEDDSGSWEEHKHVRIVDGRPVLINGKLISCKKTSHENLVIIGTGEKRLYDVTTGEFITPALYEIKESENNSEVFDVIARVNPKENNPFNFEDVLYFKINTKGKKVSYTVSSHDGPIFLWDECSVTEMLDACAREIKYRAENFETYIDRLKNSEEYLSEYQGELQQTLKYMRKEDE